MKYLLYYLNIGELENYLGHYILDKSISHNPRTLYSKVVMLFLIL